MEAPECKVLEERIGCVLPVSPPLRLSFAVVKDR